MITGELKKTEKQYRAIECDSYSTLKDFISDRQKYYRKYILGEKIKEKVTEDLVIGSLVDCLKLSPDEYHDRFEESNIKELERGKTQMGDLTIALFELAEKSMDEEGQITREFESMFEEAFNSVKYDYNGNEVKFLKKDVSYAVDKFENSEFREWYMMKRRSFNKTIIDLSQKERADKICERLDNSESTHYIFFPGSTTEIFNQLQVEYNIKGLKMKSMIDRVHIDHEKEQIQPFDLKVTWDNDDFDYSYIKNKYYIQAGCYDLALRAFYSYLPSYEILPMKFIAADSKDFNQPLVYQLSKEDIDLSLTGFWVRGYYYPGVTEIVNNLLWAKENDLWNISKGAYREKGLVPLNLKYE